MTGALVVGLLTASGSFLVMQTGLVRKVIGFVLLQHGFNVLLVIAGGTQRRRPPVGVDLEAAADPLVQALTLTAIVIGLGTTVFLIALAFRHESPDGELDRS